MEHVNLSKFIFQRKYKYTTAYSAFKDGIERNDDWWQNWHDINLFRYF